MSNEEFYKKYPHYRPAPEPKKPWDHKAFVEDTLVNLFMFCCQVVMPICLIVGLIKLVF